MTSLPTDSLLSVQNLLWRPKGKPRELIGPASVFNPVNPLPLSARTAVGNPRYCGY